jgi:hypothetical protein
MLVAHSYGGCPVGAAANGLSKVERAAASKPGGILGLIFIAAFITQANAPPLQVKPGDQVQINVHPSSHSLSQFNIICDNKYTSD